MTSIAVRPTRADLSVAEIISTHTGPRTERAAEFLSWGADEHILCALVAGRWLYCRGKDANARRASDHILLTTLVSSGLPHVLKTVFDQERPDRRTIQGHWRGVPFSGKWLDAFPSGHAVHMGALASAASTLPVKQRWSSAEKQQLVSASLEPGASVSASATTQPNERCVASRSAARR